MLLRPVASVSIWHDASGAMNKIRSIYLSGNPGSSAPVDAALKNRKKLDFKLCVCKIWNNLAVPRGCFLYPILHVLLLVLVLCTVLRSM